MRMLQGKVSPEFFARSLRPYFQAVLVDGQAYFGPAASHVPLFLVDLVLWAADRGTPDYAEFQREVVPYLIPAWRGLPPRWAGLPSVVSRLAAALREPAPSPAVRAAAPACAEVLRALIEFRGKHVVFARKAYDPDTGLYPNGSGGGTIDLLATILELTRANRDLVRPARPAKGHDQ
jgi:hypothetical protein